MAYLWGFRIVAGLDGTVSLPVVVLNSLVVSETPRSVGRTPHSKRHVMSLGREETASDAQKVCRHFFFPLWCFLPRCCGETESACPFQLHHRLSNPPKDKPFPVREPPPHPRFFRVFLRLWQVLNFLCSYTIFSSTVCRDGPIILLTLASAFPINADEWSNRRMRLT